MELEWLREALFAGQTGNGFKLGTVLGRGWFWMRVGGCLVGYRGVSPADIDFGGILTVEDPDETEVLVPGYYPHERDGIHYYVYRSVNCCGYPEKTFRAAARVWIDANGDLADSRPNNVFRFAGRCTDGDKVELFLSYHAIEQESAPVRLNIYYDNGTGQIDFGNALATISYTGRRYYEYRSGSFAAGNYQFCVRAEDRNGTEGGFVPLIRVVVGDDVPAAAQALEAKAV
jgi:hypothetical protein